MAKPTFTLYTEDANLGGYDPSKFYRAEYSFVHWDDEEHPDFIVTLRFLEKDVDNECIEHGNTQNDSQQDERHSERSLELSGKKGVERGCQLIEFMKPFLKLCRMIKERFIFLLRREWITQKPYLPNRLYLVRVSTPSRG